VRESGIGQERDHLREWRGVGTLSAKDNALSTHPRSQQQDKIVWLPQVGLRKGGARSLGESGSYDRASRECPLDPIPPRSSRDCSHDEPPSRSF
jgi:hypothetical protein